MNRLLLILLCFLPHQLFAQPDACGFNKYLASAKTPQLAKDIFLEKDWNLDANGNILAILDSLKASDKRSRPFYFKVITKSYSKADGAYAEGLGGAGKAFVEHSTKEFLSYFNKPSCFTSSDLETWAEIVILELGLMADNMHGHGFFDEYLKTLHRNCEDCSGAQKATLTTFIGLLKYNWKDYLIHSKAFEDSILYCTCKDLSVNYDIKLHVKRIEFTYKLEITVIDKTSRKIMQIIDLDTDVFENCDNVRSYSTGKNKNSESIDNDFGDLIVGDFNFDGREDIAVKRESGGNGGPPYNFYIQDRNGSFTLNTFLSDSMVYFPDDMNKKDRTLTTIVHSSAIEQCKTTFKFDPARNHWIRVSRTFIKY